MDRKSSKQGLEDFLSREGSFDMEAFTKEVNGNPSLKKVLRGLDRIREIATVEEKTVLWQKLSKELRMRRRKRMIVRWRVGAAVFIPLLCVSVFLFLKDVHVKEASVALAENRDHEEIQLFMANGKVLTLTGLKSDTLIEKENAHIRLEERGMKYMSDTTVIVPEYNVLRVPKGNEYHLVLPDNTEVWLNSDSELRFPTNFVNGERKVFLKGEGYFKVRKDASRPFRVMASELQVEVLGTCFNVNTYRDNGCLLATLVEGSVKVRDSISGQSCVLKPHQQVRLNQEGMNVQVVETAEAIAWVNGCFLFSEMPLEQIAKQLERWFDIQVLFQDSSLRAHEFTGAVKRYNSLETIFSIIEETTDVKFVVQGKNVTVVYKK